MAWENPATQTTGTLISSTTYNTLPNSLNFLGALKSGGTALSALVAESELSPSIDGFWVSTTQSITNGSAEVALVAGTEEFDDSTYYNTVNGYITVPENGYYAFFWYGSAGTTASFAVLFNTVGGGGGYGSMAELKANYIWISGCFFGELATGTNYQFKAKQDGAGAVNFTYVIMGYKLNHA